MANTAAKKITYDNKPVQVESAIRDGSGKEIAATYVVGPLSSTANHIATFSDTTGKVITDSGFTIGKSVPSNAVFTDTWTAMVGATSSANGSVGYVNAQPPKDGYNTKFLRADGTWSVPAYPTVPTKVSQLQNDSGYTANTGTVTTTGTMTSGNIVVSNGGTVIKNGYGVDNTTTTGSLINLTTWANSTNLVTRNTIAYWDGRYQTTNNKSNLSYCIKGAFGDACTYAVETTVADDSKLPTGSAVKSFVEGKGYITSSGSCNYATSAGYVALPRVSISGSPNSFGGGNSPTLITFSSPTITKNPNDNTYFTVASNNKITVNKNGVYLIMGQLHGKASSTGRLESSIGLTGTTESFYSITPLYSANSNSSSNVMAIFTMSSGQYIQLYGWTDAGTFTPGGSTTNSLDVIKIQ